jgi:hypothetical protein
LIEFGDKFIFLNLKNFMETRQIILNLAEKAVRSLGGLFEKLILKKKRVKNSRRLNKSINFLRECLMQCLLMRSYKDAFSFNFDPEFLESMRRLHRSAQSIYANAPIIDAAMVSEYRENERNYLKMREKTYQEILSLSNYMLQYTVLPELNLILKELLPVGPGLEKDPLYVALNFNHLYFYRKMILQGLILEFQGDSHAGINMNMVKMDRLCQFVELKARSPREGLKADGVRSTKTILTREDLENVKIIQTTGFKLINFPDTSCLMHLGKFMASHGTDLAALNRFLPGYANTGGCRINYELDIKYFGEASAAPPQFVAAVAAIRARLELALNRASFLQELLAALTEDNNACPECLDFCCSHGG